MACLLMLAGRKREPSACQLFKQLERKCLLLARFGHPDQNSLYFGLAGFGRKSTRLADTFTPQPFTSPSPTSFIPQVLVVEISKEEEHKECNGWVKPVFQESSPYPNLTDLNRSVPNLLCVSAFAPSGTSVSSGGTRRDTEPLAPTQEGPAVSGTQRRTRGALNVADEDSPEPPPLEEP